MSTVDVYLSVIETSMKLLFQADPRIRHDLLDAFKRKWRKHLLEMSGCSEMRSDPEAVMNRAEYYKLPFEIEALMGEDGRIGASGEVKIEGIDDNDEEDGESFGDSDFSDSGVQHVSVLGKRQHEEKERARKYAQEVYDEKRRRLIEMEELAGNGENDETVKIEYSDLESDLLEAEDFKEPSDAVVQIFAQTEICDVGGKKKSLNNGRWLVVMFNGIIKIKGKGEFLFRSGRQTFDVLPCSL
jgi:hypothetical protein